MTILFFFSGFQVSKIENFKKLYLVLDVPLEPTNEEAIAEKNICEKNHLANVSWLKQEFQLDASGLSCKKTYLQDSQEDAISNNYAFH